MISPLHRWGVVAGQGELPPAYLEEGKDYSARKIDVDRDDECLAGSSVIRRAARSVYVVAVCCVVSHTALASRRLEKYSRQ